MTTILSYENPKLFCCDLCNYSTSYSKDYNKHTLTKKHINNFNNSLNNQTVLNKKSYKCNNCSKCFNDRAGLWRHKQKCKTNTVITQDDEPTDKQLIMMLLKENSELRKEQTDIKELILEIVKNGTHNTTNNSHNTHTNSHNTIQKSNTNSKNPEFPRPIPKQACTCILTLCFEHLRVFVQLQ